MLALLPTDLTGKRVLDVGCGGGRYLLHARQRGAVTLGVDQSGQMLAQARAHGLQVMQGSVTQVPVGDAWADVVVCALTLGHVANLKAALRELARVLKHSGTLLCSDFHPIADTMGWKRTFNVADRRYAIRYTTHHYADWHTASKAAGLRIEDICEPQLNPGDLIEGQRFDVRALAAPVAIVFAMSRT